jgi:hypothetical protein
LAVDTKLNHIAIDSWRFSKLKMIDYNCLSVLTLSMIAGNAANRYQTGQIGDDHYKP